MVQGEAGDGEEEEGEEDDEGKPGEPFGGVGGQVVKEGVQGPKEPEGEPPLHHVPLKLPHHPDHRGLAHQEDHEEVAGELPRA